MITLLHTQSSSLPLADVMALAAPEWERRHERPDDSGQRLYVRWSIGAEYELPAEDQHSTDHQTGHRHNGLSASPLISIIDSELDGETIYWPLYDSLEESTQKTLSEYIHIIPGECYIVRGREIGRDTDNAPTIRVTEILGVVAREIIDDLLPPIPDGWLA